MFLESCFLENTVACLKTISPLMEVLGLLDSEENPDMGFLYTEKDSAKVKIKEIKNVKKR